MNLFAVSNPVKRVRLVTLTGMAINLLLVVFKGIGGLLSGSQALLADAVHSFSDLVTDLAVIFGVKYWTAPPDETHPYGHAKIETIISAGIGVALAAVAAGLVWDAVGALREGGSGKPHWCALAIALASIVSKELLFRWTRREARQLNSPAMEANAWHHRSDGLSSIPVAAAILLSEIFPGFVFFDAIGALLVSIFIFHAAWRITAPTLRELTDSGSESTGEAVRKIALAMPEVRAVHAIRTRGNGTTGYFCDLHVMVDPELTVRAGHHIAHELKGKLLSADLKVTDVIIHVEPFE